MLLPGRPTGRCRCWRASSRLSPASAVSVPQRKQVRIPPRRGAPRPPDWSPFWDRPGFSRPSGGAQPPWEPRGGLIPAPAPLPACVVCVAVRVSSICVCGSVSGPACCSQLAVP
ncbi:hypothetical protein CapIbe_021508 [Capra ibex]